MEPEQSYHFAVVRRAIDLIDAGRGETLDTLATAMGMSEAHLHRVFSAWAGVSPKRYRQYLALGHARQMLRDRAAVLEVAADAGLSGGGRLHDLFLRWEAMTPGDYARGGAGLTIRHATCDTPYGPAVAAVTDRGLCGLAFAAETGTEAARADLAARWPEATFVADPDSVGPVVEEATRPRGSGRLHLMGGPFQIKVWEALLSIPEGAVTTYAAIAAAIGHPAAVRAVGTAVGRNPVAWLIPCHRVLRRDGGLGGYHWGLPVKRAMLAREAARAESA